jgi:hypothetical protein
MSYYLFLDDLRSVTDAKKYIDLPMIAIDQWVIVRNYNDFVTTILKRGIPEFIAYDHDLSDEHYNAFKAKDTGGWEIDYSSFKEMTGYDCAKWLVQHCITKNEHHPNYVVHSMNPVGKTNIDQYIKNYNNFYDRG